MTPFGSSSKKPPEKQAEAEKPAEPAKSSDEWGCSVGCLGFAFILYILAAIFILPLVDPAQKDVDSAADARAAIAKTFAQALPATDVKLKQLGGYNLEIWILQKEFESITYLDRKALMDSVGAEWYKTAGFIRFSTVTVRDEKSGKNLAIYHCLFGYSDLNPN
jgi:hypothetical protein